MKNATSLIRPALLVSAAVVMMLCSNVIRTNAQTVWTVCTWDTSSIYKQKDGKEKFERRFYVTDLIATTKDTYVALTKGVPGLESPCGDYIERTVFKAAQERGERVDSSGTLKVLKNIEDSGEDVGSSNRWKFASKEEIDKKRAEMIKDATDGGRVILSFNWDLSGKNEAADLAKERQRIPGNMAAPAAPAPATKTEAPVTAPAKTSAPQTSAATNYVFGWARVLTTIVDQDRPNQINRAYYSNVVALAPNADANALKGQALAYFSQYGPPYAMKVNEKMQVKEAIVKIFPTLYEADNARFTMATQDYDKLNAGASTEVALPVSYFTWNFYGSRKDLFPNISEFVTTGYVPQWEFVVVEANVERQDARETRYYVSYPFELFMSGSESIKKNSHLDSYFTATVVEPAKQRGVKISYYDDAFEVFPHSSPYKTFAEAWAARAERLDVIKSHESPQYDFLVISNGPNKGEGTSFPFCAQLCTGERAKVTTLETRKE